MTTKALATAGPYPLTEWRCPHCGHCLGEYEMPQGTIRRRCDDCKDWNTLVVKPANEKAEEN